MNAYFYGATKCVEWNAIIGRQQKNALNSCENLFGA